VVKGEKKKEGKPAVKTEKSKTKKYRGGETNRNSIKNSKKTSSGIPNQRGNKTKRITKGGENCKRGQTPKIQRVLHLGEDTEHNPTNKGKKTIIQQRKTYNATKQQGPEKKV